MTILKSAYLNLTQLSQYKHRNLELNVNNDIPIGNETLNYISNGKLATKCPLIKSFLSHFFDLGISVPGASIRLVV